MPLAIELSGDRSPMFLPIPHRNPHSILPGSSESKACSPSLKHDLSLDMKTMFLPTLPFFDDEVVNSAS